MVYWTVREDIVVRNPVELAVEPVVARDQVALMSVASATSSAAKCCVLMLTTTRVSSQNCAREAVCATASVYVKDVRITWTS